MTQATKYYAFQHADGDTAEEAYPEWDDKGWNKKQPGMIVLYDYMKTRWGMTGLGSFGRRPIRGSSTVPSSHGTGGTFDARWAPAGAPTNEAYTESLDFLIDNSAELGVQFIGDYVGCRIWIANRNTAIYPDKWKTQRPSSSGMGKSWANWFHVELHPDEFADGRPIVQKLGFDPEVVDDLPEFRPEAGEFGLWPLNKNKPSIQVGAKGDPVRYLQGVMKLKMKQTWLRVDGEFGKITKQSVMNVQRAAGLTIDGVVGMKQTWPVIDKAALL